MSHLQDILRSGIREMVEVPVKLALYATAFSIYAPLKVEPLKSDSLISAEVKLALLYQQSFQVNECMNTAWWKCGFI